MGGAGGGEGGAADAFSGKGGGGDGNGGGGLMEMRRGGVVFVRLGIRVSQPLNASIDFLPFAMAAHNQKKGVVSRLPGHPCLSISQCLNQPHLNLSIYGAHTAPHRTHTGAGHDASALGRPLRVRRPDHGGA